ncbi:poly-gamma-glutamate biosynthesis protein PgsC/CapC [Pseudarthrobacter sp. WHRI 8279]|uniref:poly-gamma-glutamate biosynthesis protein PgsC/CapC n=1 Tax=Pseudarthrobacter sp. WHRI 8279 TaxID=3162566 RepID=UPI0032EFA394
MREYLHSPELIRLAIVLGVVVSMIFYEKVQLTTGGAIVPAYLAISLPHPLLIISTVAAGLAAWCVTHVWLPKRKILYGRRKFDVELLVGLGFVGIGTLAAGMLGSFSPMLLSLSGIGFLIPGIIAHDMGRQGPKRTLQAIAATTAILALIVYVMEEVLLLIDAVPQGDSAQLASVLGYPREFIIVGVMASVALGMLIFEKLDLRSGGFVTGGYLALVGPRWTELAFALASALLTYVIVVHLLMPRLLLFGRRKLATMILVAALVTWSGEVAVMHLTDESFVPWRGLTVVTLMVPALLANDAQRQGWEKTLWGSALAGVGAYGLTNLAAAAAVLLGWFQ